VVLTARLEGASDDTGRARGIAVIDFFTANPGRAFTLSEISVALGINLAWLSSVLRSLTDGGYLVRHPRHKTYELGTVLIASGHATTQRHPVVDLARPEMRRLAEETGTGCIGIGLFVHVVTGN
jgi:DNA-binding IclR family transcriptional regulator